ncbi:MAG: AzlD domain-containing protein [Spirochaetaceae bacterium]|jgi:branched-subunit amino acid transport protein AzlD|nr:AzlD domain-containing protein [Spirochaetaceae bacterium]
MNSLPEALGLVFAMGAVILFCRAFPFLFLSGGISQKTLGNTSLKGSLLIFVEKIVPPAAMTVLAFNSLGGAFKANLRDGLLVFATSVFTALIHLWKRNALVSIIGGTALYMILIRVIRFY